MSFDAAYIRMFGEKVENMEREFICDGDEKEPHDRESTVLIAKIGTTPAAPKCGKCGRAMRRAYASLAVRYHPTWEQGRHWV